mmetsp:Transcript_4727/g.9557  ORF Transcript_4727/g.9557 Transcript_4727/m.9557 type:complete len:202 (+) Transcript_4727:3100-3705(+)
MVSSRSSRKTNSYSVRRDGGGRRNRTVVDHIYETHIAPRFRLHERDLHQTELASREISRELLQMARDLIDRGISTVSTFDVPGTAPRLVLVRDVDEPDHSGRPVQYRPFGTNHQDSSQQPPSLADNVEDELAGTRSFFYGGGGLPPYRTTPLSALRRSIAAQLQPSSTSPPPIQPTPPRFQSIHHFRRTQLQCRPHVIDES